jgi:hypothetical protein
LAGIRLPKVESREHVRQAVETDLGGSLRVGGDAGLD